MLYIFQCSLTGCTYIKKFYIFLIQCPLCHYKMFIFSLVNFVILESMLTDISMAIPPLLWKLLPGELFSCLSLGIYLCLWILDVSFEGSICLGYFLIQSSILCLFVGEFSLFRLGLLLMYEDFLQSFCPLFSGSSVPPLVLFRCVFAYWFCLVVFHTSFLCFHFKLYVSVLKILFVVVIRFMKKNAHMP